MTLFLRLLALLALAAPPALRAQPGPPPPAAFDVATIKPVDPSHAPSMVGIMHTADGIHAEFVTLPMLLQTAYGSFKYSTDDQILNLPDWAENQRYNVEARISEADALAFKSLTPADRLARLDLMLQHLLAERFALQLHPSARQSGTYELVVAKSGFKLTPDTSTDTPGPDDAPKGSFIRMAPEGRMIVHQYSMQQLANFFTQQAHELGRPVVDRTGLPGLYSFTLNWSPGFFLFGGKAASVADPASDAPSLFSAVSALGLKLQPSTGSVPTLIIDHVDRPTPN